MKTIGKTPLVHALAVLTMTLSACNGQAQQHQEKGAKADTLAAAPDTPRTEVHVNRHCDPNGNLIAYDSTYSSFYSSHNADPAFMDSLFRDFEPRFNRRFPIMNDPGFNDLFFRDTLLYPDFFHDDFFREGLSKLLLEASEVNFAARRDARPAHSPGYVRVEQRSMDAKDPRAAQRVVWRGPLSAWR